jgi:molybdopterin-guanine dinucleotide biosynthesis protein A
MLSIVFQAGGKSQRMGRDKALVDFHGQPLIKHVIQRVERLADEILVTTNNPDSYKFLGLALFKDIFPDRGPLGGLYTALSAAHHPAVAVLACDMPFINPGLIEYQVDQINRLNADIVIPQTRSGLEPFHAVYRRDTCLEPLKTSLDSGKWRVDSWFPEVKVYAVSQDTLIKYDPQLLSFFNINTPQDLEYAVQISSNSGSGY